MNFPSHCFCLDGTRVAVLEDIKNWAKNPKSPTVCWLPGLAGTGKSTIARTIARDLKGSSFGGAFFFKKGTGNRGNGRLLFSVIAYQLAINISPLRQNIVDAVGQDESSVVAPKDIQWRRLVQEPLVAMQNTGFEKPLLLVIDALDECEEDARGEILTLLASCHTSLKVFITSRPELDIDGHFAKTRLHREIVLHRVDPGTIEQDINTFIRHAISNFVLEYNRAHPQDYMQLQTDWPGNDKTKLLVTRSLPLFIAAATFMRMVKDRHWTKSPDEKIDFIIETSTKVHSQYDPLYRPVLSLILSHSPEDDHEEITRSFTFIIGSFVLLANSLPVTSLANLLNVEPRVVFGQVDPLRSVVDVPSDDSPIRLFHLSFRDYLVSNSAGNLQVNEAKTHETLAIKCFELMKQKLKRDICGLESFAGSRFNIKSDTIEKCIPPEVQYACLYWAHHLKLSGGLSRDGDEDYFNDILSEFRSKLFLTWLEILCLIGKLSESVEIMLELRGLACGDEKEINHQFCQDAIRFVRYFQDCINQTPLQLYTSGVMFSPKLSIAPQPFSQRQYPEWASGPCNGDQAWPQGQQMLHTHDSVITGVFFLSNGRLVSLTHEGRVEIWDPASGRCLDSLSLNPKEGEFPRITHWKSSKIAIDTLKGIRIWDLDNSSCYPELVPTRWRALSMAFSDDGKLLCLRSNIKNEGAAENIPFAQIWDVERKECLNDIQPLPSFTIGLSNQGQWIACIRDESLIISHWGRDKDLSWENFGEYQQETGPRFSPDGNFLATFLTYPENYPIRVWSIKSKQCLYKFEICTTDIDLSNNRLAIGHRVHGATVIDLENGLVHAKTNESGYSNIKISHDGGFLASFNFQEPIRTWDLSTITSVEDVDYHETPVRLIALIADDNTLLSATSSDVKIWDITSHKCKETCRFTKVLPINKKSLASEKRAPYFAVEGDSGIEIWQAAPLRCNRIVEIEDYVSCLSITDDGQRLVVGCGASVKIWDLKSCELKYTLTAESDIKTVVPSVDGSQVAFATLQSIEVWKLPNNPLLKVSPNDTQSILTMAMHDQTLMCYTRKLHVWDIETNKLLLQWQPENDEETPILHESFFDYESVTDPVDPNQPILKPFYLTRHGEWVVKDGERVLWLPPEYRLDMDDSMALLTRSTMILGSGSGRVVFLPFKD